MGLPNLEGPLQRLLRNAAQGRGFLWVCMTLAFIGSLSAAYPVSIAVIPAALLMPGRWLQITVAAATGSAFGAALLMFVVHQLGWVQLYEHFPGLATHATWTPLVDWVQRYGVPSLFVIAASPLAQTPALIFLGMGSHDFVSVFFAVLFGKLLKYGVLAGLASRFPQRFGGSPSC